MTLILDQVAIRQNNQKLFPAVMRIEPGQIVTLMGPSGCGKSTLLAQPQAILLAEPFSKLDQQLKQSVRTFVFEQSSSRQIPALLVIHDRAEAPAEPIRKLGGPHA